MSKEIQLTKGYVAIVDDEDYEWLSQWKWYPSAKDGRSRTVYAVRTHNSGRKNGHRITKQYQMHRMIMNPEPGMQVDHINCNGLDNRRSNLRICTPRQNQHNRLAPSNNKSGYKGVSWRPVEKRWRASIKHAGRMITLGAFADPREAALRYDRAASELFGEYARLNFPER